MIFALKSQSGGTPKWFLPSVRDQMLSEIRVAKSRKLAPPHYVLKSESDEIVEKILLGQLFNEFMHHG